jgi:glutaredoxin 3
MKAPVSRVVMYTIGGCVHCARARALLQRLDISFEERRLDGVAEFRALLAERTGGWTVPQLVIAGEPIGGASDLARLKRRGVLPARVRGDAFPVAVLRRRPTPGRLLTAPRSARRAAWRQIVEWRDRDGRVVERCALPDTDRPPDVAADRSDVPPGPS